jgi:hypothetical protein
MSGLTALPLSPFALSASYSAEAAQHILDAAAHSFRIRMVQTTIFFAPQSA